MRAGGECNANSKDPLETGTFHRLCASFETEILDGESRAEILVNWSSI